VKPPPESERMSCQIPGEMRWWAKEIMVWDGFPTDIMGPREPLEQLYVCLLVSDSHV